MKMKKKFYENELSVRIVLNDKPQTYNQRTFLEKSSYSYNFDKFNIFNSIKRYNIKYYNKPEFFFSIFYKILVNIQYIKVLYYYNQKSEKYINNIQSYKNFNKNQILFDYTSKNKLYFQKYNLYPRVFGSNIKQNFNKYHANIRNIYFEPKKITIIKSDYFNNVLKNNEIY